MDLSQINEDWLMLKGCVIGCKKRCITLRKSLMSHSRRIHLEVRSCTLMFRYGDDVRVVLQQYHDSSAGCLHEIRALVS